MIIFFTSKIEVFAVKSEIKKFKQSTRIIDCDFLMGHIKLKISLSSLNQKRKMIKIIT